MRNFLRVGGGGAGGLGGLRESKSVRAPMVRKLSWLLDIFYTIGDSWPVVGVATATILHKSDSVGHG